MAAPLVLRGAAAAPCSKVDLRIRCDNLLDKDVTSKSDPCAVLFMQDRDRWYEVGRTENIKNTLSPQFTHAFEIDYYFEEVQKLKFAVYDLDNATPQLTDDDFLGDMECTMGQVVSGSPFTKPLMSKGKPAGKGKITIICEEMEGLNDVFNMLFRAEKLDNKDFMGKSDPYLQFSRQLTDGSWQAVHRTEVIKNNLSPSWRPLNIKAQKLCAGNLERPIKVSCLDWDEAGDHDLIGQFETSITELSQTSTGQQMNWPLINPKKQAKKKHYKNSGVLHLDACKMTKEYSFLDFIFGGLQVNFTVAVDFTASNGDPRASQSLHYINPYAPNEYQKAIQAVGAVIQDYDSDQLFPALGFGAKIPPDMSVSHEFALNFNPSNPFCQGIDGILQAYQMSITQVQLYGPTNFSPIIYHVGQFATAASREQGAKSYFVLLILTDGVISDMNDTKKAIVHASKLPMSIIIVGVGSADFTAMDILDGDAGALRSPSGETCSRDIVQFVPFRQFERAPPAELAKHVLAEIPKQVTDYYKMRGIAPDTKAAAQAAPVAPPPQ